MKKTAMASRILLGLIFLVFGCDGLFHFFPLPPMPPAAAAFLQTLIATKLFYAIKALEIGSGVLLLSGRLVRLALCLLAPIIFNILWFDTLLDPSSLPVAVIVVALEATLIWSQREAFRPLFGGSSVVSAS